MLGAQQKSPGVPGLRVSSFRRTIIAPSAESVPLPVCQVVPVLFLLPTSFKRVAVVFGLFNDHAKAHCLVGHFGQVVRHARHEPRAVEPHVHEICGAVARNRAQARVAGGARHNCRVAPVRLVGPGQACRPRSSLVLLPQSCALRPCAELAKRLQCRALH